MRRILLCLIFVPGLTAPAAASGAPMPFGHECTSQNGVRFCPTVALNQRVPSFDGVPLDVDVTLPLTGRGPWPTIVIGHGYGGNKTNAEGATPGDHANNIFYAERGYAVVTPSARGFGRSCGAPSSRTPDCAHGWIRLDDQRYEARDVQVLLGRLVDQGISDSRGLGVTGGSYGGGLSLELAYLRDRVRLPDGRYVRWRSPRGVPLQIAASHPIIPWSDLLSALIPNGRFIDFRRPTLSESRQPFGVSLQSFTNGLYLLGTISGFVSPPGADPQADLTTWNARTNAGEPFDAAVRTIADEISAHHQAWGIPGRPAPLLLESGWTDELFPVQQSLRIYNDLRVRYRRFPVALQFGDLGHMRGSNKQRSALAFNDQAAAFFDHWLRHTGPAPRPWSVTAYTQTCPKSVPDGGPFAASSWSALHPGRVAFGGGSAQTFRSDGGNPATSAAFDPVTNSDACKTVAAEHAPGTAEYERLVRRSFTLLGLPTVAARIDTTGQYGEIVARLWDVSPSGRQLLVTRGVYRLRTDQRGPVVFQLQGNGYRFAAGDTVKLELTGSDSPHWRRSNFPFSVAVSQLLISLPTAERALRAP